MIVSQSTGPGQTACHSVKVSDDVVYKKILIIIIINQRMFLVLLKMIVIINIQKQEVDATRNEKKH